MREPHPEADDDQHGGEQERDAPAPGLERGVALHRGEHEQHAGREQVAQRARRPAATRTRSRGWSSLAVLGGHQHRAAPLAADGEALHQPADQQQDRGARRRWWRTSAAGRSRRCARPIISSETTSIFLRPTRSPKWPKTTPPSGRATKPEGVGAERAAACAVHRVGVGEEQLAEDQGGGRPVEEEVVPLDGGADQAGEDDLDDRRSGVRDPVLAGPGAWVCVDMCVVPFTRRSSRHPSGMSFR